MESVKSFIIVVGGGGEDGGGGRKKSSPWTPPVATLILSRSRVGWDNKTFTANKCVSHSELLLIPGLSGGS